jgi:predicted O-methyltransferase YrrM
MSKLPYFLGKIRSLSPSRTLDFLVHPWKLEVRILSPPRLSPVPAVLSLFHEVDGMSAENCRRQFVENRGFHEALDRRMFEKRQRRVVLLDWYEFLYMTVRFLRPATVVETGVFDGQSSAVILQALTDNSRGILISVDVVADRIINDSTDLMVETTLPNGCQPGWIIPDHLRERHWLHLGDSRDVLPRISETFPTIDLFLHDSLHTLNHQLFEYRWAWTHLTDGGILMSDDILRSPAFHRFCRQNHLTYVRLESLGAVRRPRRQRA